MRTEENNLDLNNFPEQDYFKDGRQVLDHDSSSLYAGYRRKKSGANKESKDESDKVYECRFCSLKFCKSQALGGHMNRHRQERETETLNRARQLVFTNDTLVGPGPPHPHHLLGGQSMPLGGGYHHYQPEFRPVYQPRHFPGTGAASLLPQPPPQPYMYSSPTRLLQFPGGSHHFPATAPTNCNSPDYYLGHILPPNTSSGEVPNPSPNNYTCIGAPVSQDGGALNWGATRVTSTAQLMEKHRFDPARFQDGF